MWRKPLSNGTKGTLLRGFSVAKHTTKRSGGSFSVLRDRKNIWRKDGEVMRDAECGDDSIRTSGRICRWQRSEDHGDFHRKLLLSGKRTGGKTAAYTDRILWFIWKHVPGSGVRKLSFHGKKAGAVVCKLYRRGVPARLCTGSTETFPGIHRIYPGTDRRNGRRDGTDHLQLSCESGRDPCKEHGRAEIHLVFRCADPAGGTGHGTRAGTRPKNMV